MTEVRAPRQFYLRSPARSLFDVARTWVGIASMVGACASSSDWRVWSVAAVLIGTFQYHLNILGHDGLHFSLLRNRKWNDRACRWLLHGPQGAPLAVLRRNHNWHHANLGAPDDLDRQYYDLENRKTVARFDRWFAFACFGGMTLPIVVKLGRLLISGKESDRGTPKSGFSGAPHGVRNDLASIVVTQAALCWSINWATGHWFSYFLLWALPLLTVMMGLNSIRSCLEHAELPGVTRPSRRFTFSSNPCELFFLAPFNMSHHVEHHAFVGVPYHRLPALREWMVEQGLLASREFRSSYWRRFLELRAGIAEGIE
jgi:fatty acid desaturase